MSEDYDPDPFAVQMYGPFEDLPKDDEGKALLWAVRPNDPDTEGFPIILKDIGHIIDEMEWHAPGTEWVVKRRHMTEEEYLSMQEHPGW